MYRFVPRLADIPTGLRRPTVFLSVVTLVGLLSLVQLQAAVACGSFLGAVVVSWDNPTTQVVDELASQSVPHADPAGPIREEVAPARDSRATRVAGGAGSCR